MKDPRSIRTLVVPCLFGDEPGRFRLHVGTPAPGFGAVQFQLAWLRETRGGEVEPKILDALTSAPIDDRSPDQGAPPEAE